MSGAAPSYDDLFELTHQQARLIRDLEARLARFQAEADRLKAELEEARRAGKRQAAPFSEGPPKAHPKRPGRKPGHPPAHRAAPPPERVDRTVEVALPESCPGCRAPLDDLPIAVHDQYQIDLPEPKPVVTRFRVPVARCPLCRRRVQGRHPEQTSEALGAAAVQYGPRLLGFAADLKHRLGVPYRKCASALGTLCGLAIAPTPGPVLSRPAQITAPRSDPPPAEGSTAPTSATIPPPATYFVARTASSVPGRPREMARRSRRSTSGRTGRGK